jgi:hypothetical protein
MRTSIKLLAGISLAATKALATPAYATSDVTIVISNCDSLTDSDQYGCEFTGNINTRTSGNSSYLLTEAAYNDAFNPDIVLTPLAEFTGDGSSGGINFDLNGTNDGGTWTLDPGVDLDYFAVKAGNGFVLYEYTGVNSFTTAGLGGEHGDQTPDLSHIIFFGSTGGVPEPATWLMMLLGIGMVGGSMRRRRQSRAVVLA